MNAEQQEAAAWDRFMAQVAAGRAGGAFTGKVPAVLVMAQVEGVASEEQLVVGPTKVDMLVHGSLSMGNASATLSEAARLMRRAYGR